MARQTKDKDKDKTMANTKLAEEVASEVRPWVS